ncbi:uncharacterized protein [Anoplolepis gracilipes]|uniref:uncharacterized protein n=1 Tax=Anoplolepis gracilipes TaxID=354296 RepID=UPI003BA219A3
MVPFIICLLPLVMSAPLNSQKIIENHHRNITSNVVVDMHDNILINIRFVKGFDKKEINLSNFFIHKVQQNVFDNVSEVESLILDNNLLIYLPEYVFVNLKKLRKLSLSGNKLMNFEKNVFAGLENLQYLDISRNPIRSFSTGHLYGLTKHVKIFTDENILYIISMSTFTNSFQVEKLKKKHLATNDFQETSESIELFENLQKKDPLLDFQVKLCKSDGIVTLLGTFEKNEELVEGCVPVEVNAMQVKLRKQNISGFQENWYQLQSLPICSLDLSHNKITEITRETLNDLPANVTYVSFRDNYIRGIPSQVIENNYLKRLNFESNLIEEIEEGAFERLNLQRLYLEENLLKSFNFVSSLPDTLIEFVVNDNNITSIPDGVFSKLYNLLYLTLANNKIETLQNGVFRGLKSLQFLSLMNNNIVTINRSVFTDLPNLETLHLHHNSIRDLQHNTFAELTALKRLNLAFNNIVKATFGELPSSVDSLYLNHNKINVLEKGNFVQAPKLVLSLTGNQISNIKRGAFNLTDLQGLILINNQLTTLEGDSYEGLNNLKRLWLSENKISKICKGAAKNLGNVHILDISNNPFQKLENGALYGLNTNNGGFILIYENNLKEIQSGIFDDIK